MEQEKLVEYAFSISPGDIFRDINLGIATKGNCESLGRPDISYWMDDPADKFNVTLAISGEEPQSIGLRWICITYGDRAYFTCPSCGLMVSRLYLPTHSKLFKCRKCHGLQYFLTTFNKNSIAGQQLYKMNRLQKLSESRIGMSRIFYNGKYSKRFNRFLGLCQKAGFDDVVKNAESLMELIKG